jgi:DNA-binding NtrC family response regulator
MKVNGISKSHRTNCYEHSIENKTLLSWGCRDSAGATQKEDSMQANEQRACRHGEFAAALFCIDDFRHKRQGNSLALGQESCIDLGRCIAFPRQADTSWQYQEIVHSSKALREAFAFARQVAATDCTVLISGEIGTGKEMLARTIHRLSYRSPGAFVCVNCAAIPPQLLSTQLFDEQNGSRFTGMQPRPSRFLPVEGGTIFLENIGDLPPESQLALLRFLQNTESENADRNVSGQSAIRVIAAARQNLSAAVAAGFFLGDLYYRLSVFPITLPPLRECREDIPALALYFLARCSKAAGNKQPVLTRRAINLLRSYPWPGNIRELQSVMERFAILSQAESFSVDARWIPSESSGACARKFSRSLALSETDLLDAALTEMLAELPGWPSELCRE